MLLDRAARHLYAHLGSRYRFAWPLLQVPAALFVACGAIAMIASYYDPEPRQVALMLGAATSFTAIGVSLAMRAQSRSFAELMAWRESRDPSPEATREAWVTATNLTVRSFRANSLRVNAIATVPTIVLALIALELPWYEGFVLALAAFPAAA